MPVFTLTLACAARKTMQASHDLHRHMTTTAWLSPCWLSYRQLMAVAINASRTQSRRNLRQGPAPKRHRNTRLKKTIDFLPSRMLKSNQAARLPASDSLSKLSEAQSLLAARDVLLACDRTTSGGDTYLVVRPTIMYVGAPNPHTCAITRRAGRSAARTPSYAGKNFRL